MAKPESSGRMQAAVPLGVALMLLALTVASCATPPARIDARPTPDDAVEVPEATETEPGPEHVNVVIFLIDTQRADRLGTYGYDRRPTSPRIDTLAREGVVFEQACAPSPWTLPTVASLMTSTFPCEHQTLDDNDKLSAALETLSTRLKRVGYTTLALHSNPYAGVRFGVGRDFDEIKSSRHNDGDKVAKVLDRHPETPFFFYIHNGEPHNPFEAPSHTDGFADVASQVRSKIKSHSHTYRRLTRVDFINNKRIGSTDNTEEQKRHLAALTKLRDDYLELYDASVRLADTYVGSVIDSLKQRGLWENTLFILLADHGEEFNEHSGWLHDQSVYQELVHVPLIIRFPRDQYAGQRVQTVVSLVDILPTIFDYLQRPRLAHGARGRSLMPLIRGDEPAGAEDFVVPTMRINIKKYYRPWKESRGDINVVVRKGKWKAIWNFEPRTLELYDLSNDPGEQHDVSAAKPELALAMRVFAQVWYRGNSKKAARAPTQKVKVDKETLENLRELGYVD